MITIKSTSGKTIELADVKNGSDKQISWASDIKGKFVANLLCWLDQPGMSRHEERIMNVIKKLDTIEDAKWFIDNREFDNKEVIVAVEGM